MERWKLMLAIAGLVGVIDTAFLLGLIAGYAKKLGADDHYAGLIAGLYSIVALPASILAGVVVDRIGRRRSLTLGLAWDVASLAGYALASTPGQLAVVRGLHAVGGSLVYPAYMAIVGDTSPRERLGKSTGRYLSVIAASVAAGSLTSAAVVDALGFRPAFGLIAVVVAIGLIASLGVPETRPERRMGLIASLSQARALVSGAAILMFLLYIGFGAVVGGMPQALLNSGLATAEERASALTGAAIGVATLASIPLFPLAGGLIDRGRLRVAVAAPSIGAAAAILVGSGSGIPGILASFAIYGAAIASIMTGSTYLAAMTPAEARGTSMSIQQIANIAGVAVGAPLGGVAAGAGIGGVAIAVAASLILASLYTLTLPSSTRISG